MLISEAPESIASESAPAQSGSHVEPIDHRHGGSHGRQRRGGEPVAAPAITVARPGIATDMAVPSQFPAHHDGPQVGGGGGIGLDVVQRIWPVAALADADIQRIVRTMADQTVQRPFQHKAGRVVQIAGSTDDRVGSEIVAMTVIAGSGTCPRLFSGNPSPYLVVGVMIDLG